MLEVLNKREKMLNVDGNLRFKWDMKKKDHLVSYVLNQALDINRV